MPVQETANSRLQSLARRSGRLVVSLLISLAAGALCLLARRQGWLERLELLASDQIVRIEPRPSAPAAPTLVILINEADIAALPQYPIPDGSLADMLSRLVQYKPAVIGVDLFRDKPVPLYGVANDDGPARLYGILKNNQSIICTYKFKGIGTGVAPPAALLDDFEHPRNRVPIRSGFADVDVDPDGVVRRMILRITKDNREFLSFDLNVARRYLQGKRPILGLGYGSDSSVTVLEGNRLQALGLNDGPYINRPTNGIQQWHDFAGPKTFRTISWTDAMNGGLSQADVSGGIVLIGIDAETYKDHYATPISSQLPEAGTVIHARAVDQLIRAAHGQLMLRFWSKTQETNWILSWALAGGILGYAARGPRLFALLLAVGAAALIVFCYWEMRKMVWTPLVPPLVCWLAGATFVTSYMSQQEKVDRAALMNLFAKHVSKPVADAIWSRREEFIRGGKMVPRTQEATVLFTDLREFTSLSEKLKPEELISLVNEYMGRMTGVVLDHDGVVNKYIGDSIMAIFGAPIPSTTPAQIASDADRAVRCALAMRSELAKLNAEWSGTTQGHVRMRVGIHTGSLVAGSVGSAQRLEYTVLGDTVNTASRLESYDKDVFDSDIAAEGCRILIGPRTRELISPGVITRCLGPRELKGRKTALVIYGVIGAAPRSDGS
ncbi:MAG: CHASE2 domain-containing protein [Tepidisphaeraceae bacterium]|jgi:adenylate cyclase